MYILDLFFILFFQLKDDMENYMEWQLTKDVKRVKLIPGKVPHRFECQSRINPSLIERKVSRKRKHIALIEEALASPGPSTSTCPIETLDSTDNTVTNVTCDKSVQVDIRKPFRSKGTSTVFQMTSVASSPIKYCENPSVYKTFAQSDTTNFSQDNDSSDCDFECPAEESSSEEDLEDYKQHMQIGSIISIEKNPKLFLGLSPRSFFLIKLLCEEAPLPTNHIYVTLKKIRLNLPFPI